MLRLKFLKTLALCLPLLVGLLFCVVSCGEEKEEYEEKTCRDEGKELLAPCYYKSSCGLDVYVKKLKEGCFVLALEDYEKAPDPKFARSFAYDPTTGELMPLRKEYRMYYVAHTTGAQDKNLSLDVVGTKLRIFEARGYGVCPRDLRAVYLCKGLGLAIEDQIGVIADLIKVEKRKGGVYSR